MSAALRGDFARLRERGVSTTLSPGTDHAEPENAFEPPADDPAPEVTPEGPEPQRNGVFGRLFGR
jgi:hypothetical protein